MVLQQQQQQLASAVARPASYSQLLQLLQLLQQLAAIASSFLPSPMVGSAEFKAPKRKADAPEWHKSFEKAVYMASSHCAVGPSGFGLGEMIFGIEGFDLTLDGW